MEGLPGGAGAAPAERMGKLWAMSIVGMGGVLDMPLEVLRWGGAGVIVGTSIGISVGTGAGISVGTGAGISVGTGAGISVGTGAGISVV